MSKKHAFLIPHPPLLIPDVGRKNEIPNTKAAIEKIVAQIKEINPETIVIISPHSTSYGDYIHIAPGKSAEGDMGKFNAKHIKFSVDYDHEFAKLIGDIATTKELPAGPLGERDRTLDHGVTVPLHFIKHRRIVRISIAGLPLIDHYFLGMCIAEAGKQLNRKFVVIASGDMSHKLKNDGPYGFAPEGPQFDEFVRDCVQHAKWQELIQIDPDLAENAAECGLKSLVTLLGFFESHEIKSNALCYEGPFGVGYLTATFESGETALSLIEKLLDDHENVMKQTRADESEYVKLARLTVEHYVHTGKKLAPQKGLSNTLLKTRAGVFVSLKKDGELRGCIGTINPTTKNLAEEIIGNAISACSRDGRFLPVTQAELADIVYSVDVLFPAEHIKNKTELDVNRYGVIVRLGRRSGLLLPSLAGINTVDEQISIVLRKAGIHPDEPYTMERFEVIRHK